MRLIARPREHLPATTYDLGRLVRICGVVFVTVAVVAAGFAIGRRAGLGEQPNPSGDLRTLVQRGGGALVYSEFGETADTIWAADAANPDDRVAIASVPHAANYGILPSLSPDGRYIAYVAAGTTDSASLWLLDVDARTARELTEGVDIQSAPVWSPTSDAVAVRRTSASGTEIGRIDLAGGVTTIASGPDALYPIEFSPDRALYYASLSASGTDLKVARGTDIRDVARLSGGIARDWHLSPDGRTLAYLAPRSDGGFATSEVDLATGASGSAGSSSALAFNPVWAPDGTLTVGLPGAQIERAGGTAGASSGFDVPQAWSPDGAYLIVRHFEGASTADPGPSWLWAIDASGQRRRLSAHSDLVIAGWLKSAP